MVFLVENMTLIKAQHMGCVRPEVKRSVPDEYKYFAMAMVCQHPVAQAVWNSEDAISAEMRIEAHTQEHIDTVLQFVSAQRGLVTDFLEGKLDRVEHAALVADDAPRPQGPIRWNLKQRELLARAKRHLALDDAVREELASAADASVELQCSKALACFGPPGSGKTTVFLELIEETLRSGRKVLLALPTAQLASRMREKLGGKVDIATCAAAFGLMENESFPNVSLGVYSLVIVDEVSQMQARDVETVFRLWCEVGRQPCLVLAGDKWQMAGFGDVRPWASTVWKKLTRSTVLHDVYRCKDPELGRILQACRTSVPTHQQIQEFGLPKICGAFGSCLIVCFVASAWLQLCSSFEFHISDSPGEPFVGA